MFKKTDKLEIGSFPRESRLVFRDQYGFVRVVGNNVGRNRLGVTFKAKSFKTAVLRNRLKRHVFRFFRGYGAMFGDKTEKGVSFDLLIALNPPIIPLKPEEINKILENYGKHIQRITL